MAACFQGGSAPKAGAGPDAPGSGVPGDAGSTLPASPGNLGPPTIPSPVSVLIYIHATVHTENAKLCRGHRT